MWLEDRNDNYKPIPTCVECGLALSSEEAKFHEIRCERCERKWHAAMQAAQQR